MHGYKWPINCTRTRTALEKAVKLSPNGVRGVPQKLREAAAGAAAATTTAAVESDEEAEESGELDQNRINDRAKTSVEDAIKLMS